MYTSHMFFSRKERHMDRDDRIGRKKEFFSFIVPPEVTIQSFSTRLSSQMILNCTIISRPLTSVKWRHNRREIINNIQRVQINDYTIQLILVIHVRLLTRH